MFELGPCGGCGRCRTGLWGRKEMGEAGLGKRALSGGDAEVLGKLV